MAELIDFWSFIPCVIVPFIQLFSGRLQLSIFIIYHNYIGNINTYKVGRRGLNSGLPTGNTKILFTGIKKLYQFVASSLLSVVTNIKTLLLNQIAQTYFHPITEISLKPPESCFLKAFYRLLLYLCVA